jgi:hypothetical protein
MMVRVVRTGRRPSPRAVNLTRLNAGKLAYYRHWVLKKKNEAIEW